MGDTTATKRASRGHTSSRKELFPVGTRIDFGDSGEGIITARNDGRVFLESREYTGWLDEAWLASQCQHTLDD